jgi:uncharacterized membrane protein
MVRPGKGPKSSMELDEQGEAEAAADALRLLTADSRQSSHVGAKLRNYFLTGLIIVGPVGITLYVIWWFVNLVDAWVKPWVPQIYLPETYLPFTVPGVGLIFSILGLMIIGALTANLFGRTLVSYGEMMLDRMPVVRNVYRALKQIFETVLSQSGSSFQKVGLIEYPRKGLYAIVFVSTTTKGEIDKKVRKGETLLSIFLPTTPNPTSGFLLFVPEKDVLILEMSVEEAAKLVISAGLVVPQHQGELEKLAKGAKGRRKPSREAEPQPAE